MKTTVKYISQLAKTARAIGSTQTTLWFITSTQLEVYDIQVASQYHQKSLSQTMTVTKKYSTPRNTNAVYVNRMIDL